MRAGLIHFWIFTSIASVSAALFLVFPVVADPVSFRTDIMAVLSKAGCNQGTCHGNAQGKNGFKLSLRGEDPDWDFQALTRDNLGRRCNPQDPSKSLVLLKATGRVPHEGGKRFAPDSVEYQLLARWIAGGLQADNPESARFQRLEATPRKQVLVDPEQTVQIKVTATFADGRRRDVTRLAVYEPNNTVAQVGSNGRVERRQMGETTILVHYLGQRAAVQLAFLANRPAIAKEELAAAWGGQVPPPGDFIDYHVANKLQSLRILPSELAGDASFLRRAYLDALGILPAAEETRVFLSDNRPDKRELLIDDLLGRPEFADFWAQKWADLLRNEEKVLDRKGVQVFYQWIRQCIADDKPLDQFACELLTARGSTYIHPPANFYRALRDNQSRVEAVGQVFLGIRMQCARCHNHLFDRWTQSDYHSLAAFFSRIQYKIVENRRKDRNDSHEFDGEQIVWLDRQGEAKHPRTGEIMQPRLLGENVQSIPADADRLEILADWITSAKNPYFARTQANRIWFHLMGQGIVDPPDDFRASNPPSNGPLLEGLTRDFVAHGFRLKPLIRRIMTSRTYQLAAAPNSSNRDDEANFAHAVPRPLQAEQLVDGLAQVTGVPVPFNGNPPGTRAGQLPGVRPFRQRDMRPTEGEQFLKLFGKPERLLSCDCERVTDGTVNQAFVMLSGELLNRMICEPNNRLGGLLAEDKSNREIVEEFWLAALNRFPKETEWKPAVEYVDKGKDRRKALEDIIWALLNAKEFLMRQ